MPSFLVRVVLFLSSYAPLFVIFTLNGGVRGTAWVYGLLCLSVGSVSVLFWYLSLVRRGSSDEITVARVVPRDSETMSYIVTYLLPFLNIDFQDASAALALGITFVVVGILYVNSNMLYINPILSLVGYHLFEIETGEQTTAVLICRRRHIQPDARVRVVCLTPYILLENTP